METGLDDDSASAIAELCAGRGRKTRSGQGTCLRLRRGPRMLFTRNRKEGCVYKKR